MVVDRGCESKLFLLCHGAPVPDDDNGGDCSFVKSMIILKCCHFYDNKIMN